jgi:hypothetical protein
MQMRRETRWWWPLYSSPSQRLLLMLTIAALLVQIHLLRQQGVTSQQQESAVSILPFVASRSDKIGNGGSVSKQQETGQKYDSRLALGRCFARNGRANIPHLAPQARLVMVQ